MTHFLDGLADEANKVPLADKTYIYNHDCAWKANQLRSQQIQQAGHTASNVIKLDNNCFEFDLSDLEGRWQTSYGWAFVETTPDNLEVFAQLNAIENKIKTLKQLWHETYAGLETLGP